MSLYVKKLQFPYNCLTNNKKSAWSDPMSVVYNIYKISWCVLNIARIIAVLPTLLFGAASKSDNKENYNHNPM